MMIEQNTNYAYKLKYMDNPSFDKVRDLSTKFYRELPQALQDELFEALNRGIDILDSEPQMTAYLFAFGKMHQAKLNYAFSKLPKEFFEQPEINIIDYGCGQALGTMCYDDFLRENGYTQKVKTISLIEPSEMCLKRAALHASVFFPNAEIKTVNKKFDDLTQDDIVCSEETPTLHILSNVLDILNFDLDRFAELVKGCLKGYNQFVCVGPYFNFSDKDKRMSVFCSIINGEDCLSECLDKNEFFNEKTWTCQICVFKVGTIYNTPEEKEFERCKKMAEQGDAEVQKQLGVCYYYGQGVTQNYEKAFYWFEKSAEQGCYIAQYNLGMLFEEGLGTPKNYEKAFEWYTKAAEQGFAEAQNNLGILYENGFGVPQNFKKAVEWYTKAAEQGHDNAIYNLGLFYLCGDGVEKNCKKAYSLFLKASSLGLSDAKFELSKCYYYGLGTAKDEKAAMALLKEATKLNHPEACYILAKNYRAGKHVEQDEKKAFKYFKKSAELGFVKAQEALGEIYRKGGLGKEESPKKSFNWFYKAAELGSVTAQFYIGLFYATGYGIKKDENLAFEWYTKAGEQSSPAALNNLAVCYEHGKGTIVDLELAACYYERSAKLGNLTAQKNLAKCYQKGIGVNPDPNKVFYWTQEAAKQHDIESQKNLALYHLKGYGTSPSQEEALIWYARTFLGGDKNNQINDANSALRFFKVKAEEGEAQAMYMVGKCLQYGVSTDKNCKEAITYYEKAADLGHVESIIKVRRLLSLYALCSYKDKNNTIKDAYGVNYSKDKKLLISSGYQSRKEYKVANGTRVICDNAFECGSFEKIIIPSSVIAIGKNPFVECGWRRCDVKEVDCHSSQFIVLDCALYTNDMKKLISYFGNASKFSVPEGVEVIGEKAFAENENLVEIIFPESLKWIEDESFIHCLNLHSIILPKNVVEIGKRCFYGCESLSSVLFLGKIRKIEEGSFKGCNIKELSLPETLIEIGDNAFNSNHELKKIELPRHINRIGDSCFAFCSLSKISLNNDLQEIGSFCFFQCPLESVVIPSRVKIIGINPFIGTKTIECKENDRYMSENGMLYDNENGGLISYFGESEVALYPPIKRVDSFAFYNSHVTDIYMGNNIVFVAPWAFYSANKLENMIWRNSRITKIPFGCFGNCSSICKIDIPLSVDEIQKGSFFDCYGLKTIRIENPETVVNEKIFERIERPSGLPNVYAAYHQFMGSSIVEFVERDIDSNTFPTIEIIVPKGCSEKFVFSAVHDYDLYNNHSYYGYGMDRKFVVIENE